MKRKSNEKWGVTAYRRDREAQERSYLGSMSYSAPEGGGFNKRESSEGKRVYSSGQEGGPFHTRHPPRTTKDRRIHAAPDPPRNSSQPRSIGEEGVGVRGGL